jgi:uncharacterized flavoprotein (TIGR03862 family)
MKKVIIIGSGPAGLMAATQLAGTTADVLIVDHKAAPARKFLVAGDGGFNLTHSEELESFLQKYDRDQMREWVRQFTPEHFRSWLKDIGINTYVGSSGKIFPEPGTKPIDVLNAWLAQLKQPNIRYKFRTRLTDFDETTVTLQSGSNVQTVDYDFLVFALGGASWKKTGSDGSWYELFDRKGIPLRPFEPNNSGLEIVQQGFLDRFGGFIIKNICVSAGDTSVPGDLVITDYGIEGKPVYAVNRELRKTGFKGLRIDLKPQLTVEHVTQVLETNKYVRTAFDDLKIPPSVYAWLRETLSKEVFTDPKQLAMQIKGFEPDVKGLRPIDEVISTAGGVDFDGVHTDGSLKAFGNVYCAGEMLDWDAPTGGYLLQGCVASGFVVGRAIRKELSIIDG